MSQNDLVIANQTFPSTRSDINSALQALGSLQSGASAPSTTYAYMYWADTTNGVLKQRDAADSNWIIRDTLSDDRVVTKTGAYTVVLADMKKTLLGNSTGGSFTFTLPAASSAADGFECEFVKIDSSSNTVTIDGNSSETLDGAPTFVLRNQWDAIRIVCDGNNWIIKHIKREFLDEDAMTSDDAYSLASQQSIKAYVDNEISGVTSGALVLISEQTASNDGTIDFTGLSSTYDHYLIQVINVRPVNNNVQFIMQTSSDNGSNFDYGASDYQYAGGGRDSDGNTYGGQDSANGSMVLSVNRNLSNSSDLTSSFNIHLYKPSSTVQTNASWDGVIRGASVAMATIQGAGARLSAADVDAIRLWMSSGNVAEGIFKLYGVV